MLNSKKDILAGVIIISALLLAVSSVWNESPVVDEIPHIGSGYSYIAKLDYRLNPEHPPLVKDLAGIMLKLYGIHDQMAFNSAAWNKDINGQWNFGRTLIFESGNDAQRIVHAAKLPMFIFFVLSAILIFTWSGELSGPFAALMALFLFAYSPTVMAHSRLVTTDVPALFGVLFASYFFLHYLKKPDRQHIIFAGIGLGIGLLTKFSVFLLVLFFPVMAVLYGLLKYKESKLKNSFNLLLGTIGIIAFAFIFVVWPVYLFNTWNMPPAVQHAETQSILESYGNRHFADPIVYFSDKPIIRALDHYGLGLLMVNQRAIGGNTTYFMGEVSKYAWPQYFPIVYFIKEPLPFWGLVIIVLLFLGIKFRPEPVRKMGRSLCDWSAENFDKVFMLLWLVLYWYVSIRANLNIGVRHLMPVYGFTFILVADVLVSVFKSIRNPKLLRIYSILLATFLSWYLIENISIYPYYLTYFNQAAGGPSGGYRYVVDSNIDWGQDLNRLAQWMDKNKIDKINLDYFGWADPGFYINYKRINNISSTKYNSIENFLKENPNGGYIAISASFFMGSFGDPNASYAWLDNYAKLTTIGNSIFIWYIPGK